LRTLEGGPNLLDFIFRKEPEMGTTRSSYVRWFLVAVPTLCVATAVVTVGQGQSGGGHPTQPEAVEATAALGESAASNLVLRKVYFKTVNNAFLNLSTTWVDAFTDTVAACPPPNVCTIAVTVSSQFGLVTESARARVLIDGVVTPPSDTCCLNMSANGSSRPETATMTFVAPNVLTGNRLVQVQFSIPSGTGYADFRSLEIRVFKS
jgi:hypothetical protein